MIFEKFHWRNLKHKYAKTRNKMNKEFERCNEKIENKYNDYSVQELKRAKIWINIRTENIKDHRERLTFLTTMIALAIASMAAIFTYIANCGDAISIAIKYTYLSLAAIFISLLILITHLKTYISYNPLQNKIESDKIDKLISCKQSMPRKSRAHIKVHRKHRILSKFKSNR